MSKKSLLPQTRHHVFIYDEDWIFLQAAFALNGPRPIGVSAAVRHIIHQRVLQLKNQINQKLDEPKAQTQALAPEGELS